MIKKKQYAILPFTILFCMSFVGTASAQVKGLLISPKRIVFEKGERVKEVRLLNRGDTEQKYRITIVNRRMKENGQLEPAEEPAAGEFFAKPILRYGPRQVTLGPKEAQSIRLMSRLPANAKEGEYRSHVLIQEIPDADAAKAVQNQNSSGLGVNIQAIYGVTIPVFFRKGELTSEASLSNPRITNEYDSTYVKFDINRTGNKSLFGTAQIFDGDKQLAILKGIAVYLSSPKRTIAVEIPEEYAKTLSGKTLRIVYGKLQEEEDTSPTEISFKAQ